MFADPSFRVQPSHSWVTSMLFFYQIYHILPNSSPSGYKDLHSTSKVWHPVASHPHWYFIFISQIFIKHIQEAKHSPPSLSQAQFNSFNIFGLLKLTLSNLSTFANLMSMDWDLAVLNCIFLITNSFSNFSCFLGHSGLFFCVFPICCFLTN